VFHLISETAKQYVLTNWECCTC